MSEAQKYKIRDLMRECQVLRTQLHHARGLLETAVDAHECGGSVTEAWYEAAKKAGGDDE
jgi:hypothetical protein